MIASLTGKIIQKQDTSVVIDVSGVGYLASMPASELVELSIGKNITLYTYLAVKEAALDIYASQEPQVIEWFQMLLHVKGVGPKSALSIVSVARPQDLSAALQAEDPAILTNTGVSKKVAERVVLELKNKAKDLIDIKDAPNAVAITQDSEAIQALEALGYSREHAREALKGAQGDDVGAKVKSALKALGT